MDTFKIENLNKFGLCKTGIASEILMDKVDMVYGTRDTLVRCDDISDRLKALIDSLILTGNLILAERLADINFDVGEVRSYIVERT